jgi:hypothetical protein
MSNIETAAPQTDGANLAELCQRIEALAERAYGVQAAVSTILDADDGRANRGTHRLSHELARDLEALSEAFGAELLASRPAPVSGRALSLAFIQHDATRQAIARHEGPSDLPEALVDAESAALMALAVTPCKIRDIPSKLRHLIHNHMRALGPDLAPTAAAPEIIAALYFHFGKGWSERETAEAAKTWPAYAGAKDEGAQAGAGERVEA